MDDREPQNDAQLVALQLLGWVLQDGDRAARMLALTGLTPDSLRAGAGDPAVLAGVIRFVENHEPDLVAAADALAIPPASIVAARKSLET